MRQRSGNGESHQPQRYSIGKGTRPRQERMCRTAKMRGLRSGGGRKTWQEREPDAGASAGDKSLAKPVARQGSERLDIGRESMR